MGSGNSWGQLTFRHSISSSLSQAPHPLGNDGTPSLVPVVAHKIHHPPVLLVEPVQHLEHREREAVLRPGLSFVAAAGGAPDQADRTARAVV